MLDELVPLSEREIEVLKLVATGASNQEIARALVISPNTVKVHLRNIFEKLAVQSRTEATMAAIGRGWVQVDGIPGEAGAATTPAREPAGIPAAVEPEPEAEPEPEPVPLPVRRPIGTGLRIYTVLAALLVLMGALAPDWWRARSEGLRLTPMTDAGQAALPAPARVEAARWSARAPLPEPRARYGLAVAGGKLYAIGGETAGGITGAVNVYDPESNGWLSGEPKPLPASNVSAALLGDLIYVPGGTIAPDQAGSESSVFVSPLGASQSTAPPLAPGGDVTGAVEVYDPAADRWWASTPLPSPLAAYALAAHQGKLYLFGGWDGVRYRAESYVYDPATGAWAPIAPMPAPRAFAAASGLGPLLYVAGGFTGEELNTVLAYDPASDSWSARPPMSQRRGGLSLVTVGPRLYAIGGGWQEALQYHEQYDSVTGAWSRFESPFAGQWRNLAAAPFFGRIFAIGGWSGGYLASNEEYRASFTVLMPIGK